MELARNNGTANGFHYFSHLFKKIIFLRFKRFSFNFFYYTVAAFVGNGVDTKCDTPPDTRTILCSGERFTGD